MTIFLYVYVLLLTVITYLFYVPVGIYFIWKLYCYRQNIVIRKRYGNIAIIQNIFLILYILSAMTIPCSYPLVNIFTFNLGGIFVSCGFGFIYCLLTRLWAYYYDIKYDHAVNENDWSYLLNEKHSIENNIYASHNNFFVKHKANLGNYKFVSKICLILWFLSTLIIFIYGTWVEMKRDNNDKAHEIRNSFSTFISIWLNLCPCIIIAVIRCKTPVFEDHLLLRYEFKYTLNIIFVMFGVIIIDCIIYIIVDKEWIEDAVTTMGFFLVCTANFIMILLSTHWILKYVDQNENTNTKNVTLNNVFLNEDIFYEFVSHLRHEFSLELLLAFYEMVHFKKYIKICYANKLKEDVDTIHGVFEFSSDLVKPIKTYKMRNDDSIETIASYDELKYMAYYLFQQYMKKGCELEINIPYGLNRKYESLLNNKEWKSKTVEETSFADLYVLYDDCIDELYKLLRYSFYRFKQ
eukprot:427749_1